MPVALWCSVPCEIHTKLNPCTVPTTVKMIAGVAIYFDVVADLSLTIALDISNNAKPKLSRWDRVEPHAAEIPLLIRSNQCSAISGRQFSSQS